MSLQILLVEMDQQLLSFNLWVLLTFQNDK
jgi:hypothetical protein